MPRGRKQQLTMKNAKPKTILEHSLVACGQVQVWLFAYAAQHGLSTDELATQVGSLLISSVQDFHSEGFAKGVAAAGGVFTRS